MELHLASPRRTSVAIETNMPLVTLFTFLHSRSQHELEVSTKQAIFVGSSVSDTIKTCIAMGNERAALKVKSEFKVS